MKEKQDNMVHLHGYMNDVNSNELKDGKKSFLVDLATIETYKDNANELQKKYTYHKVSFITDDKAVIEKMEKIAADLQNNKENREVEGFKPAIHEASVDGALVTRVKETEDRKYYNQYIVTSAENFKTDVKQEEGEVRNFGEFKGNIAKLDIKDNFAIINIATHYFAPGEKEKTNYIETRLSGSYRKQLFNDLKDGKIEVGDLISVRGQIHNNNFEDENGNKHYKIVVDLNKIELVAKKGEKATKSEAKKEEKAEKKEEKAAPKAKKATSKKKAMTL